jgi:hypothetical protein
MSSNEVQAANKALAKITRSCKKQGHAWQPTLTRGILRCQRCKKYGACKECKPSYIPKVVLWGYCALHKHLVPHEVQAEVFV